MLPVTATRLVNGEQEIVAAIELNSGDLVLVRPGESIPADGLVQAGRSSVDESLLSGESLPLTKVPGAVLIGGSINIESPLTLRVEKTGEDTVLSAILRLLDRAQTEKPAIAVAANRAAAWFVACVLLLATVVALFWFFHDPDRWLPITIAVLVVTCPCALSLATPTAITAATGRLMRHGLVTTRGHALETLAHANTFVFDKTGTLTHGRLVLLDTHTYTPLGAGECLALAAGLEQHSEHPIARALRVTVDELRRQTATDVINTPGAGLSGVINGQRYFLGTMAFLRETADIPMDDDAFAANRSGGNTLVLLSDARQLLATFVIGDEVRAGAKTLITELLRQGKRVLLLTGDHPGAARRVARETGINEVEADLRPQDKLARVRALSSQGAIVAMVGDGVNDAAALAAAHVSVAMGSGTQIAAASADMILLSGQLPHLAEAVLVAGKAMRIIRQNMIWAVGYNLVALPFAAAGWVAPWMAALGMSASSIIVVANALRLSDRTTRTKLPANFKQP
jgi:Cu2+-exporting ATPase